MLARARVAIERSASGQTYLLVSTPTSVNEPYLDLMVEVNWASGRVVREYTFLLDPPGVAAFPRRRSSRSRRRRRRPHGPGTAAAAPAPRARAADRRRGRGGHRQARRHAFQDRERGQAARRSRSNRCWSRCSRPTPARSTAAT
ncbi:MAG: hypothetical protein IPF73_16145 [Betaproteobacteria bacterium]|nr:hypothetical protein [Betaproteobacteria bacterium]